MELWKWHRRLGHLSFDLLSSLIGLGLVRGLPKLKYQKDLLCAPCKYGKMVAASHLPLTSVMTERPCELFCDNPPRKIPYYHLNQSTLVIK
jgi:hypothetical protein